MKFRVMEMYENVLSTYNVDNNIINCRESLEKCVVYGLVAGVTDDFLSDVFSKYLDVVNLEIELKKEMLHNSAEIGENNDEIIAVIDYLCSLSGMHKLIFMKFVSDELGLQNDVNLLKKM